jgi:hypothetical protein
MQRTRTTGLGKRLVLEKGWSWKKAGLGKRLVLEKGWSWKKARASRRGQVSP